MTRGKKKDMANFIADTNKKIQDLFVYLVSCGKSSKGKT